MAEAAAAICLIASIASLIDLGAKVASRLHEFVSKTSDVPESLRSLSTRLPLLTSSLRFIASQAQAGRLPDDVVKALQPLIASTATQVSILQTYLSQISPLTDASRVQRAVKALKSLAKEGQIRMAVEKVHHDIDFLVLHQTTQNVNTGNRILEELTKLRLAYIQSPAASGGHHFPSIAAHDQSTVHLGDIYNVQLEKKIDLDKLTFVKGAAFDDYGQVHTACHPATRKDLLRDIKEWAQRPDSKSIYWLSGMAGTGKSTISYTIAQWLNMPRERDSDLVNLGASFFFKRGEGDRASAALFFPTIVRQLAQKHPGLAKCVDNVLRTDPYICSKSLGEQFDKLLRKPLYALTTHDQAHRYIVVVDALDECDNKADIETVLRLWSSLSQITNICLRLFLTSRPELPIRLGFTEMSANVYQDLILHEVPRPIVQHDILVFLEHKFAQIRKKYNVDPPSGTPLPDDWPNNKTLQELTDMAVPLFIVAATLSRFVDDEERDPQEQLNKVLQNREIGTQMAQTYLPVLEQMAASWNNRNDRLQLYGEFRTIVGSIITLAEPLSKSALEALLDLSLSTIALRLKPLHSVLQIPVDIKAPVRPLHLSFSEFLTSQELQNQPFGIDCPTTHSMLLAKCLELLSRPSPDGLSENMCNLSYPGQPRRDSDPAKVQARLPTAMQYACRYWVHHLQHSTTQLQEDDKIHNFLQQHFLHWLEALSLLDRLADAISYIEVLKSNISVRRSVYINNRNI